MVPCGAFQMNTLKQLEFEEVKLKKTPIAFIQYYLQIDSTR